MSPVSDILGEGLLVSMFLEKKQWNIFQGSNSL